MEEKPKGIVVDLDKTAIKTEERFQKCEKESNGNKRVFWECFLSERYMYLDKPNEKIVKLIQKYWQEGVRIILVSGRIKETQEKYTYYQLSTFDIPWNEAYFRSKGDFRKDYEYKAEIMKKLMQKYEILFIIDDSEEVRKAIEQMGIKAIDPALIS